MNEQIENPQVDETVDAPIAAKDVAKAIGNEHGMTLVEIMIVLTIMASIMGMVGVAVVGARNNAKIKEAETQVGIYGAAVEQFYVFTDGWPDSLEELTDPPGGQPIVEEIKDDPWGNEYRYSQGGGSRGFELCSSGPDGSSGGDDDICLGR